MATPLRRSAMLGSVRLVLWTAAVGALAWPAVRSRFGPARSRQPSAGAIVYGGASGTRAARSPLAAPPAHGAPTWGSTARPHDGQLVVNASRPGRSSRSSGGSTRCASRSTTCGSPTRTGRARCSRPTATSRRRSSAGRRCRRRAPGGDRHRQLVGARLRRGGRPQPGREPVRRLRDDPRQDRALLPRPLARAARDGDAGGRPGLPLGRLGLGRRLDRLDQGLHALLRQPGTDRPRPVCTLAPHDRRAEVSGSAARRPPLRAPERGPGRTSRAAGRPPARSGGPR